MVIQRLHHPSTIIIKKIRHTVESTVPFRCDQCFCRKGNMFSPPGCDITNFDCKVNVIFTEYSGLFARKNILVSKRRASP